MSQDYYLACEDHKEVIHIGQSSWKHGLDFYSGEPNCMKGIGIFLEKHFLCNVRCMWENPETQDGTYREYDWFGEPIPDEDY